jgi:hypothetical protein
MDTFAIRADPGGTVADPPFVFCKTVRANGKTTDTAPAKGEFLFAAMTAVLFLSSLPTSSF